MPYGTIKVDNIVFTNSGVDQTIGVSGLVQSVSGNLTVTGTISGNLIRGTTVSGATITGSVLSVTSGLFTSGVVGAPTIGFAGDGNTGFWSPAGDTVALSTGGSERIRVDADGDLGVGTTSPTSRLTVRADAASGPNTIIRVENRAASAGATTQNIKIEGIFDYNNGTSDASAGAILFGKEGTYTTATTANDSYLAFETVLNNSSTERARIDASGNLIIKGGSGDVVATSSYNLQFGNTTGTAYTQLNTLLEGSGGPNGFGGVLRFYTKGDNSSTQIERLRITSTGLVGIGTSSPGANSALEVSGNQKYLSITTNTGGGGPANPSGSGALHLGWNRSNGDGESNIIYGTGAGSAPGLQIASWDGTTYTDRVKVDSLGRVGIGTTSPQASLGFSTSIDTTPTDVSKIQLYNSSGAIYGFGVSANQLNYRAGTTGDAHVWYAGFGELARIDSSGRLLVGTSTARDTLYGAGYAPAVQFETSGSIATRGLALTYNGGTTTGGPILHFVTSRGTTAGSNTLVASGDELGSINFIGTDGTKPVHAAGIVAYVDGTPGANDMPGRLVFSTTADGASSPTQRMRINSSGALKASSVSYQDGVNPTTHVLFNKNNVSGDICLYLGMDGNAINTSSNMLVCTHIGVSDVLFIRGNGNVLNVNNSYGAISDIKLKENIVDASSQWDDLKALQVRKYNFKEGQTHTQIGLVAQEVELISPGLVTESPDRDDEGNDLGTVTKSVNYSVLYMKAVKALQEAMERIESLEAAVTALQQS